MLTSVATHYLNLDFGAICRGYADGMSFEEIRALGHSLASGAQAICAHVTVMWVMEACRLLVATGVSQEGATNPGVAV